jgi:hypothetical protein
MTKPDADFAKKVETDALTKGLSKLGFNADVFMGLYDDHKYVQEMQVEFSKEPAADHSSVIKRYTDADQGQRDLLWASINEDQRTAINKSFEGK